MSNAKRTRLIDRFDQNDDNAPSIPVFFFHFANVACSLFIFFKDRSELGDETNLFAKYSHINVERESLDWCIVFFPKAVFVRSRYFNCKM